jgi:hypothetical protein
MKSLTHVLPISMTFAAIFLLTGCTKNLDLDKSFTGGRIFTYHPDGKGRVVTSTETDPLSPSTVFSVFTYVYDAAGDMVQPSGQPSATYDDKINPLQTNNVWMFLSLNYSVHNAVAYNGIPFVDFTYDPYGLPTEMVRLPNTFFFNETGFLGQYYGDHTSISYGCDLGQPRQ